MVLGGLCLSMLSLYTTEKGWSEIYPFFFWKLYSQPAGWTLEQTNYRVYAKPANDTTWIRLENMPRATFNRDETLYFLNHVTNRLLSEQSAEDRKADLKKLKVFCNYIAPEYANYKVVAEVYNPLEIINDSLAYDTKTVIRVP